MGSTGGSRLTLSASTVFVLGAMLYLGTYYTGLARGLAPATASLFRASLSTCVVVAAGFMATAVFLWWRKGEDRGVVVFFPLSAAVAVGFLCLPGWKVARWTHPSSVDLSAWVSGSLPLVLLMVACTILGICLLLHLALVFPSGSPLLHRRGLLSWVYALVWFTLLSIGAFVAVGFWFDMVEGWRPPVWVRAAVLAVLVLLELLLLRRIVRAFRTSGWRDGLLSTPLQTVTLVSAVPPIAAFALTSADLTWGFSAEVAVMVAVIPLWVSALLFFALLLLYTLLTSAAFYRGFRASSRDERRRLRWPLWGSTLTVVVVCLAWVASLSLDPVPPEADLPRALLIESVSTLSWLLVPGSFAAGILE